MVDFPVGTIIVLLFGFLFSSKIDQHFPLVFQYTQKVQFTSSVTPYVEYAVGQMCRFGGYGIFHFYGGRLSNYFDFIQESEANSSNVDKKTRFATGDAGTSDTEEDEELEDPALISRVSPIFV